MFDNDSERDDDTLATLKLGVNPSVDIPVRRRWFQRRPVTAVVQVPAARLTISCRAENAGLLHVALTVVNVGWRSVQVEDARLEYLAISSSGLDRPPLQMPRGNLCVPRHSCATLYVRAKLDADDVRTLARAISPGETRRFSPTAGSDIRGSIEVDRGGRRSWITYAVANITPYLAWSGSAIPLAER